MLARKPNAPYQEWPSGGMADASGSEPDVREDMPVQVRPRLLKYPDGETEIIPRFERGVPGSSPGRGTDKDVLLGEQCGSNPRREGSNPSILAAL